MYRNLHTFAPLTPVRLFCRNEEKRGMSIDSTRSGTSRTILIFVSCYNVTNEKILFAFLKLCFILVKSVTVIPNLSHF